MKRNRRSKSGFAHAVESAFEIYAAFRSSRKRKAAAIARKPTERVSKSQTPFAWYASVSGLTLAIFTCLLAPEGVRSLLFGNVANTVRIIVVPPFGSNRPPSVSKKVTELFQSPQSLGVLAIGHAEGNFTAFGQPTALYYGHTDPGNFKRNRGWCSDQGRGGGNVVIADRKCLERMQQRLPLLERDLKTVGIDPQAETEVFLNAADLYNQASPWVSRQFPQKYAVARRQGKQSEVALVWARVEAFRRNGRIDASGLIGICRREKRGLSEWDCVAGDQRRRVRAIQRVLQVRGTQRPLFVFPVQGTITQSYSDAHPGIDIAGALGTPIVAAQAGEAIYAGWDEFGLGNAIKMKHPNGTFTVYGHNQTLLVRVGQQVKQGEVIAKLGSTGNSTGPHLHFEVRDRAENFVDPLPFLGEK